MRVQDLEFDDDFLTVLRLGRTVRLTRRERTLLKVLSAHPGRLFSRAQLVEHLGARGSDRTVDFVVSRLRTKLGDTGPERRFISTQYGEGYVWMGGEGQAEAEPDFLVLSQISGPRDVQLDQMLGDLVSELQLRFGAGRGVKLRLDLGREPFETGRFLIEISVHRAGGRRHGAFVLREAASREVVIALRESLSEAEPLLSTTSLADRIAEAVWKRLVLGSAVMVTPADPPLHLRLHAASVLLDPPVEVWRANGERISQLRAKQTADPSLDILWAAHLYGGLVLIVDAETLSPAAVEAIEDEIETLTLRAFRAVSHDPVMALAAAKLLFSIHRGHEALAETLATVAFTSSVAFAASFPLLGQIAAFHGDLDEALRLYDQGLELCEPGSRFESYILVLRVKALVAAGDRARVEAAYDQLYQRSPRVFHHMGPLFLPPGDTGLARRLAPLADALTDTRASQLISYLYYRVARDFEVPEHRVRIMEGPLLHLIRRFGPEIVPDPLWRVMPAELAYLKPSGRLAEASTADPGLAPHPTPA